MRIDGPSNPYHIGVAYGLRPQAPVARPAPIAPAAPASNVQGVHRAESVASISATSSTTAVGATSRLVAAVVPGRIDFTADAPMPAAPSLPMYRHPADRNAAATMVALGRSLDIQG